MGTIIALGFILCILWMKLPDTQHFKYGLIVGSGAVFAAFYLCNAWLPVLLPLILDPILGVSK